MEPLKKLYMQWGDQVRFVEVFVRQAHPGPEVPPYRDFDRKMQDAQAYHREENIPWDVVVDDLEGTVHQVYGSLSDPTYLLDAEGRVAFYNMWTYAPTLHQALEALRAQGGRGVVDGGINHRPHMTPALTDGWRGLQRGLPQSYTDMERAALGSGSMTWLGSRLKPVLGPLTLRATPLPAAVKAGLTLGAAGLVLLGFALGRRGRARG